MTSFLNLPADLVHGRVKLDEHLSGLPEEQLIDTDPIAYKLKTWLHSVNIGETKIESTIV